MRFSIGVLQRKGFKEWNEGSDIELDFQPRCEGMWILCRQIEREVNEGQRAMWMTCRRRLHSAMIHTEMGKHAL